MSGHLRIKSGILAIILGLGISMCMPMLYLLIKAMLNEQESSRTIPKPEHEFGLHAEMLPSLEPISKALDETYNQKEPEKIHVPYLERYVQSLRHFPRAFIVFTPETSRVKVFGPGMSAAPVNAGTSNVMSPTTRAGESVHEAQQHETAAPHPALQPKAGTPSGVQAETVPVNITEPTAADQMVTLTQEGIPVLAHSQILAYYGRPGTRSMGILGQYSKDTLAPMLETLAREYDALNGDLGVVPAFYIIFGTCWPEGNIGYLSKSIIREYIEFALQRGWLVFLDHQIGKYDPLKSLKTMFEFLEYPNVHLALDPEWRTTKPMQEIGYVTAEEVNKAQELLQEYLVKNKLPGPRMLVIHQFKPKMIMNRDAVQAVYDQVILIHVADGFGNPSLKKSTYAMIARAKNIPVKGFKLFYPPAIQGAGWDNPLMSPADVLSLSPVPYVIMYQ